MNIKEIKEMISLMNDNHLSELEVEKEGLRIRLKKAVSGDVTVQELRSPVMAAPIPVMPASVPVPAAKEDAAPKTSSGKALVEIKAPMVGTFYRAPSPESPPFAEINQSIEVGQVVCIIEAMKLMNEIKSDVKGKIIDVLVHNAEPIEFGQPLFLIEPA